MGSAGIGFERDPKQSRLLRGRDPAVQGRHIGNAFVNAIINGAQNGCTIQHGTGTGFGIHRRRLRLNFGWWRRKQPERTEQQDRPAPRRAWARRAAKARENSIVCKKRHQFCRIGIAHRELRDFPRRAARHRRA